MRSSPESASAFSFYIWHSSTESGLSNDTLLTLAGLWDTPEGPKWKSSGDAIPLLGPSKGYWESSSGGRESKLLSSELVLSLNSLPRPTNWDLEPSPFSCPDFSGPKLSSSSCSDSSDIISRVDIFPDSSGESCELSSSPCSGSSNIVSRTPHASFL